MLCFNQTSWLWKKKKTASQKSCFTSVAVSGSWVASTLPAPTSQASKSLRLSSCLSSLLLRSAMSGPDVKRGGIHHFFLLYAQIFCLLMRPQTEQKTIQSASWDPILPHSWVFGICRLESAASCRKALLGEQRCIELLNRSIWERYREVWLHLTQPWGEETNSSVGNSLRRQRKHKTDEISHGIEHPSLPTGTGVK